MINIRDIIAAFYAFAEPWEEVKNLKGSPIDGLIYAEIDAVIVAAIDFWLSIATGLTVFEVIAPFLFVAIPAALLLSSLICYIIVKLLTGKGSPKELGKQIFLSGAVSLPAIIFDITWGLIPGVGYLVLLWSLVVFFFVLKETYKLSNLRTLAVEFIPGIVLLMMMFILLVVMNAYIAS